MNYTIKNIACLFVLFTLSACKEKEVKQKHADRFVLSDSMMHMIALDTARMCNLSDEIALSAEIGSNKNNTVIIYPSTSGQVIDCKVSSGDRVRKGQVLAVIRSADVAGNYSESNSATADVAIARRDLDNAEALYQSGISSEKDYQNAKENYQKAIALKSKADAALQINGGARMQPGGIYSLVSPIDGFVIAKNITTGAFIRPDMSESLFTIADLKDVWVNASVYESDISKVKEGYPVIVTTLAYPNKEFKGIVNKISQVLDPGSKALTARIILPNNDLLLKPDMFARVTVESQQSEKALCIPSSAIISEDGKSYVVVYKAKDDLHIAQVEIRKSVGKKVFLASGLNEGDIVVTKKELMIYNQLLIMAQEQQ